MRVKKSDEIETILHAQNSVRDGYFKVFKKQNPSFDYYRFAISVPQKFGKAHARNKIKRQIKMIIQNQALISEYDIFLIVRPEAKTLTFQEIEARIKALIKKHKLIEVDK